MSHSLSPNSLNLLNGLQFTGYSLSQGFGLKIGVTIYGRIEREKNEIVEPPSTPISSSKDPRY